MGLWECGQSKPGPRHGRKRRTGTGRRQRGVWEAWSIQAPNAKPERSANKDCPPLSMLSAPPRTKDASSRINRRQAEVWEECGQSGPRTRNREMARIRIVHRLSTLSAPPRTKNSRTNLSNPLPPRFHPDFDHRETQLLVGQTAARCGLQSGKSARRLFSMQHLKAIRALAPLSTSGASPSLSPKNKTHL